MRLARVAGVVWCCSNCISHYRGPPTPNAARPRNFPSRHTIPITGAMTIACVAIRNKSALEQAGGRRPKE
jgi:hypothetical protein